LLLALLSLLLSAALFTSASPAHAQAPEETRPYLELPFPGETSYRLTCGYGCYQHHGSMSYAVDFDVPEGEPISAAAAGTVMAVTWEVGMPVSLNLGDALIVYIDHGKGWFTRYVHLSGITVQVGDEVEMGQVIGYGGKTGASADHLHFELKYGNSLHSPSVPIDELFGGAEPDAGTRYLSNNRPLWDLRPTVAAATPTAQPTATVPPATVVPAIPTLSPTLPALTTSTPTPSPTATPQPTPDDLLTASVDTSPESPALLTSDVGESFGSRLPQLEVGLALSSERIRAGESVTATFTLLNASDDRLRLTMLGVGGRDTGDSVLHDDTIFFDRSIFLNPGRTYTFSRPHRFEEAGDVELFVFALGPENEWVPLSGEGQTARLTVEQGQPSLYLPLMFGPAPAQPEPSSALEPESTQEPEAIPQPEPTPAAESNLNTERYVDISDWLR
jgi:pyruvate/2-oxoglutarate dehydrogenase complex dihydrolipoamide acyltransferase (E2) component